MSWNSSTLGSVCELINRGIAPSYVDDGGILVLNQKCIRNHTVNYELSRRHDSLKRPVKEERLIRAGDVLVNSTGTGTLGRVALVLREPLEPTTVDTHITIVRPKKGMFDKSFFGLMLISIEEKIKQAGEGSVGQTELSRVKLRDEFVVSYSSDISLQKKVADKLDAIFAEIDKATSAVKANSKNAEALFKCYLNQVFEGGSEGWTEKPLPTLCTLFNGRAYSKDELLDSGKYTVLRVGNFFTNEHWYYSNLELEDNKYCENGDLLYAWSASFGPRIWHKDKVIYHYHIWKVVPNSVVIDKMFLYYLLEWDVDKIKRDHGTGATMIHVSKKSMESRVLPYIDLKRQKDVVLRLEAMKSHAESLKRQYAIKVKELNSYKNSILKQAFNGELIKD